MATFAQNTPNYMAFFGFLSPQISMAFAAAGLVLLFLAWQQWQYFPNILKHGKETEGTTIPPPHTNAQALIGLGKRYVSGTLCINRGGNLP